MAKLIRLSILNFCVIAEATIELDNQGLVLVTGENLDTEAAVNNGAGKSTAILHGLSWGIYGDLPDKKKKYDRVIRRGASKAMVTVDLEENGVLWSIVRSRALGKPGLELFYGGEIWGGRSDDIQIKINELMGVDYRSFSSTIAFGQGGDDARFFSATDSEKKEILHKVLRTSIFSKCEALVKSDIASHSIKISEYTLKEQDIIARISECDISGITQLSNGWSSNKSREIKDINRKIDEIKKQAIRIRNDSKLAKSEFEARRKRLEIELERSEDIYGGLELLVEKSSKLSSVESKLSARISALRSRLSEYKKSVAQLGSDSCPLCHSSLTTGVPKKYVDELRSNIRDSLESIRELENKLLVVKDASRTICDRISEIKRGKRPEEIRLEISDVNREIAETDYSSKIEILKQQVFGYQDRLRAINEEANPYEGQLVSMAERIRELNVKLDSIREERKGLDVYMGRLSFWLRGFGLRGIPSLLLDSVMPEISVKTNEYLKILSDGDITVEFSTQKELKSKKELKEEISDICNIEGVKDTIPSHGQLKKIEIATDFALIDLASSVGNHFGILVLDEVLDGLDAEGADRVFILLRSIKNRFGSIFVVSHDSTLASRFDRVINVVKKGGSATVG